MTSSYRALGFLLVTGSVTSVASCSGGSSGNGTTPPATADGGGSVDAGAKPDAAVNDDAGVDPYKAVYDAVDPASIQTFLRQVSGADAVMVGGAQVNITDRWSATSKANFRAYYKQYFEGLGATVTELPFATTVDSTHNPVPGETMGHNIEAVLPGESKDSLVIIVHYDSVGIKGKETENPGVDDDGTGVAMLLEAARIFAKIPDRKNTVRFVAADYEEISKNLDGDFAYVQYLLNKSNAEKFRILAASDNDQTGWSCWNEDPSLCRKLSGGLTFPKNTTLELITCSGDSKGYNYPELRDGFLEVARTYQTNMLPNAVCNGNGDTDHYPFWVAGIPAYVIDEWGSDNNPHFDDTGGDTLEKVDFEYLTAISRIQITFQAKLMGIK